MSSKERKAKAILKLLEDMKWPLLNPFTGELLHGGLKSEGSPRGPLQSDEVYIGRYSPLADAIRDWQHTREKE